MARTLSIKEIEYIKSQQKTLKGQCNKLNDLIDNNTDTEFDLVKGYYNYMFYCTSIEFLIQQIFLYTFDSETYLKLFGFDKKTSDLISPEQLKILLTEDWLNNNLSKVDYDLIKQKYCKYNNISGIFANIDIDKFIQYYSHIKSIRNNISHKLSPNDLSYKIDIVIQFEIVLKILNLRIEYLSTNKLLKYN